LLYSLYHQVLLLFNLYPTNIYYCSISLNWRIEKFSLLPLSPLLPSLSSLDRFSRLELGCDRGGGSVRSGELPKLLEVKARAFLVFVVGKGDIIYLFISSD
jgi:hypothetical protein